MKLDEFIKTGKKGRLANSDNKLYGNIVEIAGSFRFVADIDESGASKFEKTLTLMDIFSDQWELERHPRTFFLGIHKVQSHMNVREILQAVETPDNLPPKGNTGNHQPWIKVIEILD